MVYHRRRSYKQFYAQSEESPVINDHGRISVS